MSEHKHTAGPHPPRLDARNTKMKLYIANTFDRPDERHIAEKRLDGRFYYIHPTLCDEPVYWGMTPNNPTPLEEFGIDVAVDDGILEGRLVRESEATYDTGEERRWQGGSPFSFKVGVATVKPETIIEWLECTEPDPEEAAKKLVGLILSEKKESGYEDDIETLAEYLNEFDQDDDPVSMGWVGQDGRP